MGQRELDGAVATRSTAAATGSREQWHSLVENSPVAVAVLDVLGGFAYANPRAVALYGGDDAADLIGRPASDFVQSGSEDITRDLFVAALKGETIEGLRWVLRRFDGAVLDVEIYATRVVWQHEPAVQVELRDVSEQVAAETALRESETNLASVAKVVKLIQSGSDARQTVVDAAYSLSHGSVAALVEPMDGSLRVTASTDPELVGHEVGLTSASISVKVFTTGDAVFVPDTENDSLRPTASAELAAARSLYVVPVCSADAITGVLVVAWSEPTKDLSSRRPAVVAMLADHAGVAMRQSALVAELEALALTDTLTGLPNRRSWEQHLTVMLASARRRQMPLTVGLADLDHFKRFNDTHGHLAGDSLLRHFAVDGRSAVREVDMIARWGGEEFAVALPDCPAAEAPAVLTRIAAALPADQTCSIGYAVWDGEESAAELMARADRALYAAKRAGRNRVHAAR